MTSTMNAGLAGNFPQEHLMRGPLSHPMVKFPLLFAVFCLFAMPVLRHWAIAGILSGVMIAGLGLLHHFIIVRPSRVERDEESANSEPLLLLGPELREALARPANSGDLVDLYERYELIRREVSGTMDLPSVSESARMQFRPLVAENERSAAELFNYLVFVNEHLEALGAPRAGRRERFGEKLRQLSEQRARLVAQLEEIITALERVSVEVPRFGEEPIEDARERLRRLEQSLESARRAYESLRADEPGDIPPMRPIKH